MVNVGVEGYLNIYDAVVNGMVEYSLSGEEQEDTPLLVEYAEPSALPLLEKKIKVQMRKVTVTQSKIHD